MRMHPVVVITTLLSGMAWGQVPPPEVSMRVETIDGQRVLIIDERSVRHHAPTPWHVSAAVDLWEEGLDSFNVASQTPYGGTGRGLLRARVGVSRWFESMYFAAELDLYGDQLHGDTADLGSARVDRYTAENPPFHGLPILPRKLMLVLERPAATVVVGHGSRHWGLGIVTNDGRRDGRLFGDATRGDLVERVAARLFPFRGTHGSFHPLGRLYGQIGGAFIFADERASLFEHNGLGLQDTAYEAVFAGGVEAPRALRKDVDFDHAASGGVRIVARRQTDAADIRTDVLNLSLHGRYDQRFGGQKLRYEVESAWYSGSVAEPGGTAANDARIDSFGGAAEIEWSGRLLSPTTFTLLGGLASGDGDPQDSDRRAFVFHGDYDVGVVLLDRVLPVLQQQTVLVDEAASWAASPRRRAGPVGRGGLTGAQYVGLRATTRPLDGFEAGLQYLSFRTLGPTLVDPVRTFAAGGRVRGPFGAAQGGLGHEFDLSLRYRFAPLAAGLKPSARLTWGLLVPGEVLDDLNTVHFVQLKLAMTFDGDLK